MSQAVDHAVGEPLDQALIHTVCTDCRMKLHKLRAQLEEAEHWPCVTHRTERIYEAVTKAQRALHRIEARVHVCCRAT